MRIAPNAKCQRVPVLAVHAWFIDLVLTALHESPTLLHIEPVGFSALGASRLCATKIYDMIVIDIEKGDHFVDAYITSWCARHTSDLKRAVYLSTG